MIPSLTAHSARTGAKPNLVSTAKSLLATSLLTAALVSASPPSYDNGLQVDISVAGGLLNTSVDGRISLMFAPAGVDPLDDTEVDTSPNKFFGKNVYSYSASDTVTLSAGSGSNTRLGVYGYPNVSIEEISPGNYTVQAFLNIYDKVERSDGSVVSVRFPCGDGAANVDGFGSLLTSALDVEISGGEQSISLEFNAVEPLQNFTGHEIGGCQQGNYEDTEYLSTSRSAVPSSASSGAATCTSARTCSFLTAMLQATLPNATQWSTNRATGRQVAERSDTLQPTSPPPGTAV